MPDHIADPVYNPAHYTVYPVQAIEITRHLGFCLGNAVKYTLRAPWKGGVEDCDKALQYLLWEQETPHLTLLTMRARGWGNFWIRRRGILSGAIFRRCRVLP